MHTVNPQREARPQIQARLCMWTYT